jgi:hypothetical protein
MQTIIRAKLFTSIIVLTALPAAAEWKIDFSRRQQQTRSSDMRSPASVGVHAPEPTLLQAVLQGGEAAQEIVVLNTDKGFVPNTLRVRRGEVYQIHVVNVNDKERNVSFVLDSFSEHHATYYGKLKSFVIRPVKEGVYKFVSPETAAQGKLVVYPGAAENRSPASE